MAKNIETEQERNERETLDRINGRIQERAAKMGEQVKDALTKAAEAAEKDRKRKQAREVGCCFLASVGIGGLYLAQTAGLIAPVLANPVIAFCYIYFGYHFGQIGKYRGRK